MRVIALQNFDGYRKGQELDLPTSYARAVIAKGIAKEAPGHLNKMRDGIQNKGPSRTAGAPSSASRAVRASQQTTARSSDDGESPGQGGLL